MKNCEYFNNCGGCDFLDLDQESYQKIKQESLKKYHDNNIDWSWVGPHSRRKIILQIDKNNGLGFFAKKSRQITKINSCFIAEKEISNLIPTLQKLSNKLARNLFKQISITLFDNGLDIIFIASKEPDFEQTQKLMEFGREQNLNISISCNKEISPIFRIRNNQIFYPDFKIDLTSEIFIQATKIGLETIIKNIRNFITQNNAQNIVDIYAGFGAYSFAICDIAKSVTAFEGSEEMVKMINQNAAANNLSNIIKATQTDLFNEPISKRQLQDFDCAIINPPRNGAGPQIAEIAKSNIKNLIYISCNPQSFFRDEKILTSQNFKLTKLTALDQFYGSKHLELIGVFSVN